MSTASIRSTLDAKLRRKFLSISNLYRDREGVGVDTFKEILLEVLETIDSIRGESIYAILSKSSNQTSVGVDTDISFETSLVGGTGMSFSTPTLTLPEGHIFRVEGQLTCFSFSGAASYLEYDIVDSTNTPIASSVTGISNNVANNGLGGDGKAWAIVDTTGGSVDIKLRTTGANGTATIDVEGTGLWAYKI